MGNHECYFHNDTKYHVVIHDYDGRRSLQPGDKQYNYLLKGGSYHVNLILEIPGYGTETVKFHDYQYQNRTHRISTIFGNYIRGYEERRR